MKLSEAIKIGARKRPQQFENAFFMDHGGRLCSCAMGAAWEAVTGKTTNDSLNIIEAFPELMSVKLKNPVTSFESDLFNVIADLNDVQKWSREKIASWLESLGN